MTPTVGNTPIASNAASLGYSAPVTTTPAAVTAPTPNVQAVNSPNAAVATGYDPNPVVGGGAVTDFIGNAASRFATIAQSGMKRLEEAMNGDIAANGGQVDAAKMQQYTMQMSTYEMIMQMAAKIQEKQERAAQVWLQL